MSEVSNTDLIGLVKEKRRQVEGFIAGALPRKRRLLNLAIIGGTCAAALTAAPALGGQSFTAWLTAVFGLNAPSWQLLCAAAAVCSVAATVSTQLLKSHQIEERVVQAQHCRARLEMIEIGLVTRQMDPAQAAAEYMKCVGEATFLEGA